MAEKELENMQALFHYNWMVRDEWLELLKQLPREELLRSRVGGAGSILYTLFHIVDVEYSWIIFGIQGKPDTEPNFGDYQSLDRVKDFSDSCRSEIASFLESWSGENEREKVTVSWSETAYTQGEIVRHVIAHEIHHMGQLSIWARELGLQPVSANFIGRGLL
ncbi:hypothetical protein I532_19966 [Brevibacillus borstelensis AK1]|uniref:DinB family protein n=2 Tax=Brevibacillus TaxID=55080 RepID=M8DC29_9BACL|nr:hypothetical protein I532_19966 [Brevibacillus borstelensis AK1]